MSVGAGEHAPNREPGAFDQQGPLDPRLSAVHRRGTGVLAAAGGFHDAPVRGKVFQVQADGLVIGIERRLVQGGEDSGGNPLIPPGPQCCRGDPVVGVLLIGAAQHEPGQELVEHDPVWHSRAMAPQRVGDLPVREERVELVPQGFGDEGGQDGHVTFS
jgi:hypothetical protein